MLSLSDNYFQLFQLEPQFDIDSTALTQRYRALQSEVHPDRHVDADPAQYRKMVQLSAHINEGHQVLKSPLRRAQYLLSLQGFNAEGDRTMSPDSAFLMQQIEWREALSEIDETADPEAAVGELEDEVRASQCIISREFASAYAAQDYDTASHLIDRWQFIEKFLVQIGEVEEHLSAR